MTSSKSAQDARSGGSAAGCVTVLYQDPPSLEGVAEAFLSDDGVDSVDIESDSIRIELPEAVVRASAFAAPWPDDDPESLAQLGSGASGVDPAGQLQPGALARAGNQNAVWPPGEHAARAHGGFVHITVEEHIAAPAAITGRLERLAASLLADPRALCVFFPLGESLRDGHVLGQIRAQAAQQEALPLQSFINGRLADAGMGTHVADLIGLIQVGLRDFEAVFPERQDLSPYEVLGFLLDVTQHLASEGGALEEGVVYEGPGGLRWRAGMQADAQIPPERKVVRWIPLAPEEAP